MPQERLQKRLARAGVASRRRAEEFILAGRVKVNGEVIRELGVKADPDRDLIEVNGKRLRIEEKKIYVLLYKPRGYVTTARDPQGRPTVLDLLPDIKTRVFPVGRLDYDTEGLLLLTNDGQLTFALTHPRHKVPKTYLALVEGIPGEAKLQELRQGVPLEDGLTAPALVRLAGKEGRRAWLEITIHEGRNRQVRRMCEYIGHPVIHLKRTSLAFLNLKGLHKGQYRFLTGEEIRKLKQLTGLERKK